MDYTELKKMAEMDRKQDEVAEILAEVFGQGVDLEATIITLPKDYYVYLGINYANETAFVDFRFEKEGGVFEFGCAVVEAITVLARATELLEENMAYVLASGNINEEDDRFWSIVKTEDFGRDVDSDDTVLFLVSEDCFDGEYLVTIELPETMDLEVWENLIERVARRVFGW